MLEGLILWCTDGVGQEEMDGKEVCKGEERVRVVAAEAHVQGGV